MADFLKDDDFESDRFKRLLYTFALKFAGVVKQFDSSLRRDIRGIDKAQVKPAVSPFGRRDCKMIIGSAKGLHCGSDQPEFGTWVLSHSLVCTAHSFACSPLFLSNQLMRSVSTSPPSELFYSFQLVVENCEKNLNK